MLLDTAAGALAALRVILTILLSEKRLSLMTSSRLLEALTSGFKWIEKSGAGQICVALARSTAHKKKEGMCIYLTPAHSCPKKLPAVCRVSPRRAIAVTKTACHACVIVR